MPLNAWRKCLNHIFGLSRTAPIRRPIRPRLEVLEERWVPAITAVGQAASLVEGAANPVIVATFTDSTPSQATDYTASINWGDATSSAGAVSLSGTTFTVTGSHTYAEETPAGSPFAVTAAITETVGDLDTATATGSATVTDPPVILSPVAVPSTKEGQALNNQTVATFTDPGGAESTSDYTGTINWGDGSTPSTGTFAVDFTAATPVSLLSSGFNQDVVFEAGTANPTITQAFDQASHALFQSGAVDNTSTTQNAGLQTTFTSNQGTPFAFQSFGAKNALLLGNGNATTGTLTLGMPASYGGLAILATSADIGGSATGTFTINFSDGTSSNPINFDATDWSTTDANAVFPTGSVLNATSSGGAFTGTDFSVQMFETDVDLTALGLSGKTIQSITFSAPTGSTGETGIFAVSATNGFVVKGSHTYADETAAGSPNTITVTVHHDAATPDASTTTTVDVTENDTLAPSGSTTISALEGATFTGDVATFSDTNTANTAADFTASIDWGDGTVETGPAQGVNVTGGNGTFTVTYTGTHVYTEESAAGTPYAVAVTLTDDAPGTATATFKTTADVADQQITNLTVTPPPGIAENQSTPNNFNIANFTDPAGQGNETAADFTANVNFGDGSVAVAATVVSDGGGNYHVEVASHKYGDEGTHAITVTVTHDLLAPVSASAPIVLADTPVVVTSGPQISAVEGGSTNFVQVASFSDPGDVDSIPDYAATVNWGDGTTPDSTTDINPKVFITQVGVNKFIVLGTHVYAEEAPAGGFTVTTTITHGASHVALVADNANGTVETIDTNSNAILGSVPITGGNPLETAISPDGTLGFVTNFSNNLFVIDLSSPFNPTVVNTIPISNVGEDLAVTPDGQFVVTVGNQSLISVVSVASKTEVSTFDLGAAVPAQSVDASVPGIVLVTSDGNNTVTELAIDDAGALTSTGATLSFTNPLNVVTAPGGKAGVVLSYSTGTLESFTVPSLTAVDSRTLSNHNGLSAVFNPAGTEVYVRSTVTAGNASNSVDAFGFDPTTGALSATPTFSISVATASSFYGIDQLAISSDGTRLFVPDGTTHTIDVFDASTGASLGSIPAGANSNPIGIAIGANPGVVSTGTTTALVSDPAVSATGGFTFNATEGVASTTQTVATFTDPAGAELTGGQPTPGEYSATINWGDGSPASTGTITFSGGTFTVQGSHQYAEEGNFPISVTLAHGTAPNTTVTSSATVSDQAVTLNSTPLAFSGTEGQASTSQAVATFTDPAGAESLTEYVATIDWGDGSGPTSGTITFSGGTFTVSGSHTYAEEGNFPINVTVSHGTATAVTSNTANATAFISLNANERFVQALYLDELVSAGAQNRPPKGA